MNNATELSGDCAQARDVVLALSTFSFNGAFINLVFALTSQFCGAISTPE